MVIDRDELVSTMERIYTPLLKALADRDDMITVKYEMGESSLIVRVLAPKSEIGKIIGSHGKTVTALRILLHRLTGKFKVRSYLEVVE